MESENKTIEKNGGTITISSVAEPTNPTLTYSQINVSWANRVNNVITVDANTGTTDRSFDLSVTATTTANTVYDGTATDTKTFTFTQSGQGSVPMGTWYFVNESSVYGLYGTWNTNTEASSIAVDLNQGETKTQNTPIPLTLTGFNGVITPNVQTSGVVTFTNTRSGESATMSNVAGYEPSYQEWTGSMEVQEGDYINVTIQVN